MGDRQFAGSDWIKSNITSNAQVEMSPLGEAVADLLGDLFFGIYHLDTLALKRVNWANDYYITLSLGWQGMATFDSDELTRLVILCHDRCIRCEVQASAHKYLELMFHQRKREGQHHERHPTIEKAIEITRRIYAPELVSGATAGSENELGSGPENEDITPEEMIDQFLFDLLDAIHDQNEIISVLLGQDETPIDPSRYAEIIETNRLNKEKLAMLAGWSGWQPGQAGNVEGPL